MELFSLERLSKAPAVFDPEKLKWMNNHYIEDPDLDRIVNLCVPHLEQAGRIPKERTPEQDAWVERLIGLYQEQLRYGAEIVELTDLFFRNQLSYSDDAKAVLAEDHVLDVLKAFQKQVEALEAFRPIRCNRRSKGRKRRAGRRASNCLCLCGQR